jgi:hypothetical protein
MHPDDDPALKAAFAELHRRRRQHAPAFAAMREHALRKANESRTSAQFIQVTAPLAWTGVACAMALMIWWGAQTSRYRALPRHDAAANSDVEKLISAIEQHLEGNDVEYPTDLLLVENQAEIAR